MLLTDPKNAYAYIGRGLAWSGKNEFDKAIADYTEAVAADPKSAIAYDCRGNAWRRKGEYGKAIADSVKAVAIDSKHESAYDNLALIYSTCPNAKYRDGQKAVEYANKAHQLSGGKIWYYVATLAAAYAESGDFAKAQEFQAKAIELVPKAAKPNYRTRLELYKQRKSYRE